MRVGDRVRYSDGEVVTVEDVTDGYIAVRTANHGICVEKIETVQLVDESVTEGPIRTVTRREIVPGVYSGVDVCYRHTLGVTLRFVNTDSDGAVSMTANELREAAHLFSQLAEVLSDA